MKLCDLGASKERESVCVCVRERTASAEWETNPPPHESENTLGCQNPKPRKNYHLSG
jgi:hypothetical protein